jgi:hypothetical protein
MITLSARRMRENTTATLAPRAIPLACRARGSFPRGEFFGTYLAQIPGLRDF